jgi:hypothetical protein
MRELTICTSVAELANLRKAFEEDKAKVADLKAKNRFKPY